MKKIICILSLLALAACGTSGQGPTSVKVGKPYSVSGKTYVPEHDPSYSETGIASWYGPGFHGKKTANGEEFDTNDFTAAHPTLPMPSMVRVTNLKNGKEVVVRINDRGPFKPGRIIDLSRAAAKSIDIHGIEQVKVEYLEQETERYWAENNIKTGKIKFSKNSPVEKPDYDSEGQTATAYDATDEASAPIISISQNDVVKPVANKSVRPKFSLVSDAYAYESSIPKNKPTKNNNILEESSPQIGRIQEDETELMDTAPVEEKNMNSSFSPLKVSEGYIIQAGAFSLEENANTLAHRLSSIGSVVTISPTPNSRLYRVLIGPEPSHERAQGIASRLNEFGISDARILTK